MSAPEPSDDPTSDDKTRDEIRRHLDDASVDAAFADIVAMWRADSGDGAGTTGGEARAAEPDANGGSVAGPTLPPTGHGPGTTGADGPGSNPDSAAIDEIFAARRRRIEREIEQRVDGPDGGHFVPPEPAPLPQLDLFTLLAWAGALLGPILIVIAAFTGGLVPRWIIAAAVAATIGGFVLLVSRLPRRGEADPDDDGAIV